MSFTRYTDAKVTFDVWTAEHIRDFQAVVDIDRVQTYIRAAYDNADLTLGTVKRLLGDLIRQHGLTEAQASALTLGEAMDRLERAALWKELEAILPSFPGTWIGTAPQDRGGPCWQDPSAYFSPEDWETPATIRIAADRERESHCLRRERACESIGEYVPPELREKAAMLVDLADAAWQEIWVKRLFTVELQPATAAHLRDWCRLQQFAIEVAGESFRGIQAVGQGPWGLLRLTLPFYWQRPLTFAPAWHRALLRVADECRPVASPTPLLQESELLGLTKAAWSHMRLIDGPDIPHMPLTVTNLDDAVRALDEVVRWCDRQPSPSTASDGKAIVAAEPLALAPPTAIVSASKRTRESVTAMLINALTNGVSNERISAAVDTAMDLSLTVNGKLEKHGALFGTSSAKDLATLLGCSKTAVINSAWWTQNRAGTRESEQDRRQTIHRQRAKQIIYPSDKDNAR